MEHEGSTFLSGCASRAGFFYFAKEDDELVEQDEPNSSFFRFRDGDAQAQFRKFDESVGWPAISMAYAKLEPSPIVVAISPYGDYWELESVTPDERVGKIAKFEGNLRRLASVDGKIYACGMDRVALRRTGEGRWTAFGPGPLPDDPKVVGFEDIDGYGGAEMYAVGWGGEIWWYDGKKWRQADSPTSAILTSMTCAGDGAVYAVGHDGVMVKGRKDQWTLVDTGRDEHLKDVELYAGEVYVCSDFAIFRLGPAGLAEEVEFAKKGDKPATCLHLFATPGELVSLGTKDVFVKREARWFRLV